MAVGARVFGSNRFDRVRKLFADRFEPEDDGFLYRSSATAAPVDVSAAERDAFVAQFNQRLNWLHWGMLALMTVGIGVYVWATISFDLPVSSVPLYVGSGVILLAYLLGWRMVWAAPQRALAGRNAAGAGRTREEVKRTALAKMTWAQIGGAALLIAGGMLRIGWREDLLHGWNRLWLVFFALAWAAVVVGAFRKWRFDREAGARRPPTFQ
jgi:hypothetical protein